MDRVRVYTDCGTVYQNYRCPYDFEYFDREPEQPEFKYALILNFSAALILHTVHRHPVVLVPPIWGQFYSVGTRNIPYGFLYLLE